MQLADGDHSTAPETRSYTLYSFTSDSLSLSAGFNIPLQYPKDRNVALYLTWSPATQGKTSRYHYPRFQVLLGEAKRAFTSILQVSQ